MKIALAQIKPQKGDIAKNIASHLHFISLAHQHRADLIVFPELSLTGYEPDLAKELALPISDKRLDIFQSYSDEKEITIAIGLPLKTEFGIQISMGIFSPKKKRMLHSKKYLHADEMPFFKSGTHYQNLNIGNKKIALAICYEISVEEHLVQALSTKPDIYIASVAKHENGMKQAFKRMKQIAEENKLTTLVVNNIGYCDNFFGYGKSAIWNKNGKLINNLDSDKEGLLVFDSVEESAEVLQIE